MLYPAKQFSDQLKWCLSEVATNPDYDWWHGEYAQLELDIIDSFWTSAQFVSIHPCDKEAGVTSPVIGYIRAHIKRPHFYVDNIGLVNFRPEHKNIYAADVRAFFKYLVAHLRVRKIIWGCGEGSPASKFYERVSKIMNARKVGTYYKHYMTPDNELHNYTEYEFLNDCFTCTHCGYSEKKEQEVICWKCGLGEMVYHEIRPSWIKKVKYNGVSF